MISEVIPDMINIQNFRIPRNYKYLCFPIDEGSQLLRFYNINKEFLFEMNDIKEEVMVKPVYSVIESKISFYNRNLQRTGYSFRNKYSQRLNFLYSSNNVEIIVLSRKSEDRPVRWCNVDECTDEIECIDMISVKKVDAKHHNPKTMLEILRRKQERIIYLCSPGSAAYTPLLMTTVEVIMPIPMKPSIEPEKWKSHLLDFMIYASKLILVFDRKSGENEQWDKLFKINKSDFRSIVSIIAGKQKIDRTMLVDSTDNRVEIKYGTCGVNMPKEVWNRLIR